jgi:hypothetical protein
MELPTNAQPRSLGPPGFISPLTTLLLADTNNAMYTIDSKAKNTSVAASAPTFNLAYFLLKNSFY